MTIALRKNVEKPTTNYHDDLCRVFAHRDFTFDDVSDRKSNKLTLRESRLSINLTYYGDSQNQSTTSRRCYRFKKEI